MSLLKAASSALGIGAHQAMRVAETLYLAGYLSYPRTESTAYPPGTDLDAPLRAQAAAREEEREARVKLAQRAIAVQHQQAWLAAIILSRQSQIVAAPLFDDEQTEGGQKAGRGQTGV